MPDVLIRDVPEAVLAKLDAHAARLGISRVEYIRGRLAADAATSSAHVSTKDLRKLADSFADLADEEVMETAWRNRLADRQVRPGTPGGQPRLRGVGPAGSNDGWSGSPP